MPKRPNYGDCIYEEIRQCEQYALLNMITFEATIRNSRVKQLLCCLDYAGSEAIMDAMLDGANCLESYKQELRDTYLLNYTDYAEYQRRREQFFNPDEKRDDTKEKRGEETETAQFHCTEQVREYKKWISGYNLIVKHTDLNTHTHHLSLPFYRPKVYIPQRDNIIKIEVPAYLIHPKDIKDYYQRIAEKHSDVMEDARFYYEIEEQFFDTANMSKNKAVKYAKMFFVWDSVQWWKENYKSTSQESMTKRTFYAEIAEIVGASINDNSGRSSTVEKDLETMNRLIEKCEYRQFYGVQDLKECQ